MALPKQIGLRLLQPSLVPRAFSQHSFQYSRRPWLPVRRSYSQPSPPASEKALSKETYQDGVHTKSATPSLTSSSSSEKSSDSTPVTPTTDTDNSSLPPGWEEEEYASIGKFSELPHRDFGRNQMIGMNEDFRKALTDIIRAFSPAPITYAFAYGSGVFPQSDASLSSAALSPHPHPPEAILKWQKGGGKVIDFIFGVTFTQHWHSINLRQFRDHYSFLGSLGSGLISHVQDRYGAGVYFNPYITVNGTMIKYGITNLDNLYRDLSEWETLYLAGRLQKPVKILRDNPRIRYANQINLISAVRTALLMLPQQFTEQELFNTIAGLSYTGDPRVDFGAEHPHKITNIVTHQLTSFRQLYNPLINDLPNLRHKDPSALTAAADRPGTEIMLEQDMDPIKRGNMVRRLPSKFRQKLYFQYQKKFQIPGREFKALLAESKDEDASGSFKKRQGGEFDRRIATQDDLPERVREAIRNTVKWPSTIESLKGILTAGPQRSWKYLGAKLAKGKEGAASAQNKST